MTSFSGAADNSSDFDGHSLLLQCENNEYVYISGLEFCKFKTVVEIIDFIFFIGNNMVPYATIQGEKYTYFSYHRYKCTENAKIEERIFFNATNNSLDPFDYHLEKCGIDFLENWNVV